MSKLFFILPCISLFFCSCAALPPGTIKIGGSYDGIGGSIEYTINPKDSKTVGVPVLDGKKEGGEPAGKAYIISDEIMTQINKLLPADKTLKPQAFPGDLMHVISVLKKLKK